MRTMRVLTIGLIALLALPQAALACVPSQPALGLERVIEIDASGGPLFGTLTKQRYEPDFLRDKEVVLTFDDGPSPWVTPKILDELDRHCTKATFFSVGKMAVSYPAIAIDIIARGHTLAGHTWSHPRQLPKMKPEKAAEEIERGFAALEAATGGGIAPFFRFTGLNDSAGLLTYLQERGVASFTVDVVSDDSFIASPEELARVTLKRTRARGRGILLFHDIKPATAKALPAILDGLAQDGFKVVHLRHVKPYEAQADFVEGYRPKVLDKLARSRRVPRLMPFYGAISSIRDDAVDGARHEPLGTKKPVTTLAPKPRDRKERRLVIKEAPASKPASTSRPPKAQSPRNRAAATSQSSGETTPPVATSTSDADEILPWKTELTPPVQQLQSGRAVPASPYVR